MASIRGATRFRAVPAAVALLLAAAGALGLSLLPGGEAGRTRVVVDVSPSCEPPDPIPAGARPSNGSDLGVVLAAAAAGGDVERIEIHTDAVHTGRHPPLVPPVPVDVVLRPRRDGIRLLALRAPARVPAGSDFSIEVEVGRTLGPGGGPVEVSVRLQRDGERVGAEGHRIQLDRGQRRTLRIRDRVDSAGLVRYLALVTSPFGEERSGGVTLVGDRPLVVSIGGAEVAGSFLTLSLRPDEVASFLGRAGSPAAVDAFLLAGPLPQAAAQAAVAGAVRGGAGLLVLGGRGFAGSPLESVLPLTDTPSAGRAVLLLLDYSGSMEGRREALIRAVERMRSVLAPGDRLAFLAFRGQVFRRQPWETARTADWDLRLPARGNTSLLPALVEAAAMLEDAGTGLRRLFVVSDGRWADAEDPHVGEILSQIRGAGIHVAAVLVGEERRPELFPVALVGAEELEGALERLERQAPDRVVTGPVRAEIGEVPTWLAGAVPGPGEYVEIGRLYPRGVELDIALRAGDLPLVAARRPGGRVVMVTAEPAANPELAAALPALLRACVRSGRDALLVARRAEGGLQLEARGEGTGDFVVEGEKVAARPAGPGCWRARLARVSEGPLTVSWGGRVLVVAPAATDELAGLTNRPDIAASIAARSGGKLYEGQPPPLRDGGRAVYWTLLGAALLVLASALVRSGR